MPEMSSAARLAAEETRRTALPGGFPCPACEFEILPAACLSRREQYEGSGRKRHFLCAGEPCEHFEPLPGLRPPEEAPKPNPDRLVVEPREVRPVKPVSEARKEAEMETKPEKVKKPKRTCMECGNPTSGKSPRCQSCAMKHARAQGGRWPRRREGAGTCLDCGATVSAQALRCKSCAAKVTNAERYRIRMGAAAPAEIPGKAGETPAPVISFMNVQPLGLEAALDVGLLAECVHLVECAEESRGRKVSNFVRLKTAVTLYDVLSRSAVYVGP